MIECKIILPWFDPDGNELKAEHDELRDRLIKRYGYLSRIRSEDFYHDPPTGKLILISGFQYLIVCEASEIEDFRTIGTEIARRCRQPHLVLMCGHSTAQIIDLQDYRDADNWRAFANERLRARDKDNSHWVKAVVK